MRTRFSKSSKPSAALARRRRKLRQSALRPDHQQRRFESLEARTLLTGFSSLDPAGSLIYQSTETEVAGSEAVVFLADFESGDQGFIVDNAAPGGYLDGLWHLSTGRGVQPGHSASQSFYYGQGEGADGGGTYQLGTPTPTRGTITSPPISLPTGGPLWLDFNHVLQTRVFPTDVDFAELRINDGSGWTPLQRYDRVAETSTWTTTDPIDLSAYAGETIELQWSFDTRRGPVGRDPEGWYVDDVQITTLVPDNTPDTFTIDVDPGQTISVAVETAPSLQAGVTLLAGATGNNVVASGTASAPGEAVVLQIVHTAGQIANNGPGAKTYRIVVEGLNDTVGEYSVQTTLNSALETERYGGASNNTTDTAQDLDPSFLQLHRAGNAATSGAQPARGAVLGTADGPLFSESQTQTSTLFSPNVLTYTFSTPPIDAGGGTISLTALSDLDGSFEYVALDIDGIVMQDVFVTGGSQCGISFDTVALTESQLSAITADGTVTMTFTPSGAVGGFCGGEFLTVDLVYGPPLSDYYAFDLEAGESATLTLTKLGVGDVGLQLRNSFDMTVALGSDADQSISDFVASTSGTYYAVVGGDKGVDYSLVVTRNAEFDNASNDDLDSAQDVLSQQVAGARWVLGSVNSSGFYRVTVDQLATLEAETATPAGGSGELVNDLDPMIRVYDSAGNRVAETDNSAADGRNAKLSYKVPRGAAGTYFIEVLASAATDQPTSGEYILSVKSATGALPPFEVSASDPFDGQRARGATTQITVDFNDTILLSSVDAGDLTVDGAAATGVSVVDGDTLTFDVPTTLTEGNHHVQIAAGAIVDVQNTPLEPFEITFYEDITPPSVVASSIQENDVLPAGDLTYTVQFSEPMRTSNLDLSDFTLRGTVIHNVVYTPTSFEFDPDGRTLTLQYANLPEDRYSLVLLSGNGRFEDRAEPDGWNLDGEPLAFPIPPNQSGDGVEGGDFVVNFDMDFVIVPYPVPLEPKAPLGSLIYDPSVTAFIQPADDTDSYTIELDTGQTITVVVDPASDLQPAVQLLGPSGTTLGSATAASAGQDAVLQTVSVTTAGTYTVTVAGTAGTTGLYTAQVILNAAVEDESHDGADNDALETAQDLEPSFIALGGNGGGDQPTRGAVIGQLEEFTLVNTIFLADFESGDQGFTVDNTASGGYLPGMWHLSTGRGAQPGHSSSQSFYYGQGEGPDGGGSYQLGTPTPTRGTITSPPIVLPGGATILADFNHVLQTRGFPNDVDFAELQVDDGGGWTTLRRYDRVAETSTWTTTDPVNLSDYVGQTVQLRWSFDTRRGPVGRGPEGWYVDDVRVSEAALDDYYSFQLQAGESATAVLTVLSGSNAHVTLVAADGSTLASGSTGATNVDEVISNFVATDSGSFYLRVTGDPGTVYSLVVTRNADFDTEDNNDIASAQEVVSTQVAGSQWVLGALEALAALVEEVEPNDTIATAQNIDDESWNLEFSPNIGDRSSNTSETIPHVTILGTGNDTFDNYSFTVANAGDVGIFDLDFGIGGGSFDSWIRLFASDGTQLASNDDSSTSWGQGGSVSGLDSYIEYTFTAPGQYIIQVGRYCCPSPVPSGATYELQVSVQNHPLGQPDTDYYEVVLSEGQPLRVETSTPSGGPGEFQNQLDPAIFVYDSAGNLVASDDNSAADGRNAVVSYSVPSGGAGTYFVRVAPSSATAEPTVGEYVLSVEGNVSGGALYLDGDPISDGAAPLSDAALQSVLSEAIGFWQSEGVDRASLDALSSIDVRTADLVGSMLGHAFDGAIVIDQNAAGHGWSFGSASSGGVDLVSTVVHELGHVLGFDHLDHLDHLNVMRPTLSPGAPLVSDGLRPLAAGGALFGTLVDERSIMAIARAWSMNGSSLLSNGLSTEGRGGDRAASDGLRSIASETLRLDASFDGGEEPDSDDLLSEWNQVARDQEESDAVIDEDLLDLLAEALAE